MTETPSLRSRLMYFAGTGGTAALVHLLAVLLLVTLMALPPLVANVLAFLVAFNVSYLGHKHLTFAGLEDKKELRLPHFFLVAASAGAANEFLYFLVLHYTRLNYLFALVLVIGVVAIYTFILSRLWACR